MCFANTANNWPCLKVCDLKQNDRVPFPNLMNMLVWATWSYLLFNDHVLLCVFENYTISTFDHVFWFRINSFVYKLIINDLVYGCCFFFVLLNMLFVLRSLNTRSMLEFDQQVYNRSYWKHSCTEYAHSCLTMINVFNQSCL